MGMALFDDLTRKAAKMGEELIDKSQELADSVQAQLRVKNMECDRDDVYKELGEYCYRYFQTHDYDDKNLTEFFTRIEKYENDIDELKRMIDEE